MFLFEVLKQLSAQFRYLGALSLYQSDMAGDCLALHLFDEIRQTITARVQVRVID